MGSPESIDATTLDGKGETPKPNLGRPDISVIHSPDGNENLQARWDIGEDGQVSIIKPLSGERSVVVPLSIRQNGEEAI